MHTIIRLPQSTFFPATVSTNLLFFEKGNPTKEIWYYEHKLPDGQKSYSKTKPIQFKEFETLIKWWNEREENHQAWKVNVKDLKEFDLDIKNKNVADEETLMSSKEITDLLNESLFRSQKLLNELSS